MALFITFEGGEGSGKTTQIGLLVKRLSDKNLHVITAEEPGTTLLGRMLSAWIHGREQPLTLIPRDKTQLPLFERPPDDRTLPSIFFKGRAPYAELLAFTIARAQLVEEVISPNLTNNNVVVCDRYADSTVAYQGYGQGLDLKLIEIANTIATKGIKPNLTILLDIDPKEGLRRKLEKEKEDRFETQVLDLLDFHRRVRNGYLELAKDEPNRWLVIDATLSQKAIADIIWTKVGPLLP